MSFLSGLRVIEIVYWSSAIIGGMLFLFRTLLLFLAGDVDGMDMDGVDGDFDPDFGDADTDLSFKLLSLQGITAFFMMFGLSGLAFLSGGVSDVLSGLGSVVIGVFSVWVVSLIFAFFTRMQADGTLRSVNAIGQTGTVYLRIPPNGTGQIQVTIQGGLKIYNAKSATNEEIATGEPVKVVDTIGESLLIIEKI
ncbi:NfeD family protein [Candidatus Leptofilum sp.]|uniref:NfeD family protein n=1 Tax=Candidatus Leptofilum sp. TaxID=3241576 RepID=UPI003B5BF962